MPVAQARVLAVDRCSKSTGHPAEASSSKLTSSVPVEVHRVAAEGATFIIEAILREFIKAAEVPSDAAEGATCTIVSE